VLLFGEKDPPAGAVHPQTAPHCEESCCADKERHNAIVRALRFGFLVLPRDIAKSLLFGVVVAGAIGAFVPADQLKPYLGNEFLSILAMIALGIPLYVCATASVPIAAGLIHLGASPGAALAFLIAGPATNAATVSTAWKLLGKRSALLYLATIALSAILCGLALDWLISVVSIHLPNLSPHEHHHMASSNWASNLWAVALLAVMALSYLWPSGAAAESHEHQHDNGKNPESSVRETTLESNDAAAQHLEFIISGMTCDHCAAAVNRALKETAGARNATVDLATGRAAVSGVGLDSQQLIDAVKSLGYNAVEVK
jgi:copper chaperone CopZ